LATLDRPLALITGIEGVTIGEGIAMRTLCLALATALAASGVRAEVVIQGGQILPGPAIEVPAGVGERRGGNLFHSFQVFNVIGAQGESVTFTGPAAVKNVVSRVTGGTSAITGLKSSFIDGPVAVAIPGANFYFINPNGVVFGESGSVQADGSVYIATADAVRFRDGAAFYADPSKNSTLTAAPPSAFGFLAASPAQIEMNGPFIFAPVPPGKTFTLVGGDIEIKTATYGTAIVAPGATVSLASVASPGDAVLRENGAVDVSGFSKLGRVRLDAPSWIDVSEVDAGSIFIRAGELTLSESSLLAQNYGAGAPGRVDIDVRGGIRVSNTSFIDVSGDGAGTIFMRGGDMTVSGSYLLAMTFGDRDGGIVDIAVSRDLKLEKDPNTGFISAIDVTTENLDSARAVPAIRLGAGGTLAVSGESVVVAGTGSLSVQADSVQLSATGAETAVFSAEILEGTAGSLTVDARTLELRDGAQISSSTGKTGAAGNVLVNAAESVRIAGESSGIFSTVGAGASGRGGSVQVVTPLLAIDGGLIDSSTFGDGAAGSVSVSAGQLTLAGGGQIRSFSGGVDPVTGKLVVGTGSAGSVTISAANRLEAFGTTNQGAPSGILAQTRGPGAGGDVQVTTPVLVMGSGALIGADTGGTGRGGNVLVSVGTADLSGGARISSGSGITVLGRDLPAAGKPGGDGGTVQVQAQDSIRLTGPGTAIAANTRTSGRGGDVAVSAKNLVLGSDATISSSSIGTGLAGDVSVALGDSLTMRGAGIETQAVTSDGGNIAISLPGLVDLIDSRITTSVQSGEGGGGNIDIARPQFVVLQRSQIIANAFGGPGGNIDIVAGQLITDPASVIEASSALGIDGNVNIDAPNPDVGSNLVVLPDTFLDVARLLQPSCGAARAGLSSLVEVGRGGLPADPDGYLPSAGAGVALDAWGPGAASGAPPESSSVLATLNCTR
jgi:filamentous hemagglutinin family protein